MEIYENGFDLTHFENVDDFRMLLLMLGACAEGVLNEKEKWFEWRGVNGTLITANNPLSGKSAGSRGDEIGYASYMRLETKSHSIGVLICAFINRVADVKEFTPGSARFI